MIAETTLLAGGLVLTNTSVLINMGTTHRKFKKTAEALQILQNEIDAQKAEIKITQTGVAAVAGAGILSSLITAITIHKNSSEINMLKARLTELETKTNNLSNNVSWLIGCTGAGASAAAAAAKAAK